jgi:hypothetical protein
MNRHFSSVENHDAQCQVSRISCAESGRESSVLLILKCLCLSLLVVAVATRINSASILLESITPLKR